jgi:hypothetical protein
LVPAERVDTLITLAPDTCRHCAHRLHARDAVGAPRRHQVTELPPITPHITEYRCQRQADRDLQRAFQRSLHDQARQPPDHGQVRNQGGQLGAELRGFATTTANSTCVASCSSRT